MKQQAMRIVQLVTAVECGIPGCQATTTTTIFEEVGRGYYTTIELAPFCPAHEREMEKRWRRRYYGGPR